MRGSLPLFLGLLLVILASPSRTAGETQNVVSAQSPDATNLSSTPSGSPDTTTQSSTSSGSSDTPTQSSTSSGSSDATTQSSTSSGSSDATTQSSTSSGSSDTPTQSSTPSGSPDTTTQSSTSSGSPDATTPSSTPSGSPDATTQSSTPSGSPDATTQSSTPSGSPDATTQSPVTSQSPQTNSSVTNPSPGNLCESNSCGDAFCVKLHSEYFCLCPQDYYYQNLACVKGKTFPGEISMQVKEPFNFGDKESLPYQNFYNEVINFFAGALNKTDFGFGQTVILKVSDSSSLSARSVVRAAASKIVYVSVVNMFDKNTTQNEITISAAIREKINEDTDVKTYTKQDMCDYYNCKKSSDNCQDHFQCECKPGLERPNALAPCLAEFPEFCSAEEGKQGLKNNNTAPKCVCMPGYQKTADGKCEECPFGYSGKDCKDQFQLILTIVGTIAGALILILLIALIASVSSKKRNKNVEEQKLIDEDRRNIRMQQTGFSNSGFSNSGFSNFGGDNSFFPKVRTGATNYTQNPYANQRSMSRPDY